MFDVWTPTLCHWGAVFGVLESSVSQCNVVFWCLGLPWCVCLVSGTPMLCHCGAVVGIFSNVVSGVFNFCVLLGLLCKPL